MPRHRLAPTVCLHRSPLGGRNFESFSEDPLLTGKLAARYIKGVQSERVAATIKHFAANEQETRRFTMNVNASERALRELYLKPFEMAIKQAKPWAVMTSYNLVNGVHADCSEFLLQTVLRGQWKWSGLVMSDWGGTNAGAQSVRAGLDLEMPGPAIQRTPAKIRASVEAGEVTVKEIDKCVTEILTLAEKIGKFDDRPDTPAEQAIDLPEHRALIRKAGAAGTVLLRNERNILPLSKEKQKRIAVLGLAKECVAHGGGSAAVNCHYKISPWDALTNHLGEEFDLRFAQGTFEVAPWPSHPCRPPPCNAQLMRLSCKQVPTCFGTCRNGKTTSLPTTESRALRLPRMRPRIWLGSRCIPASPRPRGTWLGAG